MEVKTGYANDTEQFLRDYYRDKPEELRTMLGAMVEWKLRRGQADRVITYLDVILRGSGNDAANPVWADGMDTVLRGVADGGDAGPDGCAG